MSDPKQLTPAELEGDLIRELQRLIKSRGLHAELVDKRTDVAKDICTHCTICPCMVIG